MGNSHKERPHMPPSQRAKQFLPFDAVAGLREALKVKEHEMGLISRAELSEEVSDHINEVLQEIRTGDHVSVKYFRDEEGFAGEGCMEAAEGTVERIDTISGTVTIRKDDAGSDRHGFKEQLLVRIVDMTSIEISGNE